MKKNLIYTNDFYDYVKSFSEKNDHTDGFAVLKQEYIDLNEVEDVTDEEVEEWATQMMYDDFDNLLSNLKYSENNKPCIITGYWASHPQYACYYGSGKREIVPVKKDDLVSAIEKCVTDMVFITINKVNGHLEIETCDHDGSMRFQINLLNERGIKAYERMEYEYGKADLSNPCYHKAMTKYLY